MKPTRRLMFQFRFTARAISFRSKSGLLATLRRTLAQSAGAIMWSLRMIGVAIAFLAPWVIAIVAIVWIAKRISRAERQNRNRRASVQTPIHGKAFHRNAVQLRCAPAETSLLYVRNES